MKKKVYSSQDIERINLNESGILSISWVNEESDLKFSIDWCGQEDLRGLFDFNNITTYMYFDWATNIEFNFKYKEKHVKALEITNFKYSKNEDGTFNIGFVFEYQPVGYIKFRCNEFKFIIEEKDK